LLKNRTKFISSPQFTYTGADQFSRPARALAGSGSNLCCAPEFTDELTLKYFIWLMQIADRRG